MFSLPHTEGEQEGLPFHPEAKLWPKLTLRTKIMSSIGCIFMEMWNVENSRGLLMT